MEEYNDQEHFFKTSSPEIANTNTIIELYKASEVTTLEEEPILENIKNWTNNFLKRQLLNQEFCDDQLLKEVHIIVLQLIYSFSNTFNWPGTYFATSVYLLIS